jgi:hypothetical protein
MVIISHRGNLNGVNSELENRPSYIEKALKKFDVEIDLWYKNGWFLGHNKPQYRITCRWLYNNSCRLWIHCKNLEALYKLASKDLNIGVSMPNYFWHQNDDFTLTSHKFIWNHCSNKRTTPQSIIVDLDGKEQYNNIYGICTDYPLEYKNDRC